MSSCMNHKKRSCRSYEKRAGVLNALRRENFARQQRRGFLETLRRIRPIGRRLPLHSAVKNADQMRKEG